MKAMKIIKKVFITTLAVIFFGFVIAMTVLLLNFNDYGITVFGDKSLILIKGDTASEKYEKGNLVIVEQQKLDKINVGDEIFAYKINEDRSVSVEYGTVGEVSVEYKQVSFENGGDYTSDLLIGKATKVYGGIGSYLSVLESRWGFLFIILVPCFLVFIYQVYSLIIEVKYGKDEEETKPKK